MDDEDKSFFNLSKDLQYRILFYCLEDLWDLKVFFFLTNKTIAARFMDQVFSFRVGKMLLVLTLPNYVTYLARSYSEITSCLKGWIITFAPPLKWTHRSTETLYQWTITHSPCIQQFCLVLPLYATRVPFKKERVNFIHTLPYEVFIASLNLSIFARWNENGFPKVLPFFSENSYLIQIEDFRSRIDQYMRYLLKKSSSINCGKSVLTLLDYAIIQLFFGTDGSSIYLIGWVEEDTSLLNGVYKKKVKM